MFNMNVCEFRVPTELQYLLDDWVDSGYHSLGIYVSRWSLSFPSRDWYEAARVLSDCSHLLGYIASENFVFAASSAAKVALVLG